MLNYRVKFVSSDTSIAADSTEVDGTDFISVQVNTKYATFASLTLYAVGANSSSSGSVKFAFAGYDSLRESWDSDAYIATSTLTLTLNGTTAVQKTFSVYPDTEKIKLLSVENTDATYAATVNASIFIKESR